MLRKFLLVLILAAITACDSSTSGGADTSATNPEDFFRGKNLTYIVATNAGGGYDTYARLISKYMEQVFDVNNILIRNIPGAGHIVGTNTLWKEPPNGLAIGTFNAGLIYNQLASRSSIQFKIEEFEWVGKAAGEPRALIVSENCEIQSMEDLLAATEPVKFASAGIGTAGYTDIKLLAEAFDLNLQIIPGFDGTQGDMAMMRGEVCAQLGTTSSLQPLVNAGYGSFILMVGGSIDGVPNAMQYANSPRARKIIGLVDAMAQLGRITIGPPGIPPDRLKILQEAYRAALFNPDLLAEAEKLGLPIEYMHGDEVKRLIINALDQDPDVIQLITDLLNTTG